MKIVCDSCATKYSISDDKVRGKTFKIRCKKCGHVIVVRGGAGDPDITATSPGDGEAATRVFNPAALEAARAQQGGDTTESQGWHLVLGGEQVGPLTMADLRDRVLGGEVDRDTYVWREGLTDWMALGSVAELASLLGPGATSNGTHDSDATERADLASLLPKAAAAEPGDRLFASPRMAPEEGTARLYSGASSSNPAAADADLFATSTSSGAASASFGAAEPLSSPRVDAPAMTGQRHENSVLFSLTNLQALALGADKPSMAQGPSADRSSSSGSSTSDASGLLDIRAMAANTLSGDASSLASSSHGMGSEDLPTFGMTGFSPMTAPVLMPNAHMGMPKWVWGVLAGAGVLLAALIVMVVILFSREKPEQASHPQGTHEALPHPTPALRPPPKVAIAHPGDPTPDKKAPAPEGVNPPENESAKTARPTAMATAKHRKQAEPGPEMASPLPRSDQPVAPTKLPSKAPKAGGDELDALLNKAIGGSAPPAPRPSTSSAPSDEGASKHSAADDNLPDTLSPRDIQGNMSKVKSRVSSCYAQFGVPGTVFLDVMISPGGRVQSAVATGKFSGTPTGECVARAARGASFPRFKGGAISIQYPFMLSK